MIEAQSSCTATPPSPAHRRGNVQHCRLDARSSSSSSGGGGSKRVFKWRLSAPSPPQSKQKQASPLQLQTAVPLTAHEAVVCAPSKRNTTGPRRSTCARPGQRQFCSAPTSTALSGAKRVSGSTSPSGESSADLMSSYCGMEQRNERPQRSRKCERVSACVSVSVCLCVCVCA